MKQTTKLLIAGMLILFSFSAKNSKACYAYFTHTNGCVGDTIWFNAQDLFAVYTWDFGDSTGAVNINHDTATWHVYNTPGTYYVSLFVNIGAEWDYQTQIITVGSSCFSADFTSSCAGGTGSMYFYDASYGAPTSWSWNFGDPASGASNTSSLANPTHIFTTVGPYTVTLITSNGTLSDTTIQTVTVPAGCVSATVYPGIFGNCMGDTTVFNVYYSGTITSYSWNFGDPASGLNNTSTLSNPTHVYNSMGIYMVTLTVSNGTWSSTSTSCFCITDCRVWPGDTDRNGIVNMEDIFPLGMFNGDTGTPRSTVTTTFAAQSGADWSATSWAYMYLSTMADKKHGDCNGDGTINTTDFNAVNTNYGMSHYSHNNVSSMPEALPTEPTMWLQFPGTTATGGTTITASINFGTAAIPVQNLYGYSFTIEYDPSQVIPNSTTIDLSSNFLGTSANEFMITHDDGNGHIDGAVVRKDKVQLASGYGLIGTVTFHLLSWASGSFSPTIACSAKALSTTQWSSTTSGTQEIYHPFNLMGDAVMVTVGVEDTELANLISVYPNPASDYMNVSPVGTTIEEITLTNSLGQVVYTAHGDAMNTVTICTTGLAKGIYSINCKTEKGIAVKKLSILK
jgi:PKD repeat protein